MEVNADRDQSNYSLTRAGTFKIGSTSGSIPFKVRRLTGLSRCEALVLKDDDRVHVNELYRSIQRKEMAKISGANGERDALIDNLGEMMSGTGSDVNMLHLSLPKVKKITPEFMDGLADILYHTKNNGLILPPFGSNPHFLKHWHLFLEKMNLRGEIGPIRQVIGLIPARISDTMTDVMIDEYHKMGVTVYAVDAAGGGIPDGRLGRINARLDHYLECKYILMVIGQPEVAQGLRGQTTEATDVVSMPFGYDGYAPNRAAFMKKNKKKPKRWKELTLRDVKGKKRLFVPDFWGRTEFSAVFTDQPELVSASRGSEYCTRTSSRNDILSLFEDDSVDEGEFKDILRCHDTELVEMEFEETAQAALEGIIEETIKAKDFAAMKIDRIVLEKNEYDRTSRSVTAQQTF